MVRRDAKEVFELLHSIRFSSIYIKKNTILESVLIHTRQPPPPKCSLAFRFIIPDFGTLVVYLDSVACRENGKLTQARTVSRLLFHVQSRDILSPASPYTAALRSNFR